MTPDQVFTVAAIGGITGVLALAVFVATAAGLYAALSRLFNAHQALRERRRVLKTCRAIEALGTTERQEPK